MADLDRDANDFLESYRRDWTAFIEEQLGVETWSGMRLIIESVQQNQRTSLRACHGISKTICLAAIAVAFLNLYKPAIVITTAPTGRQVKHLLWKEIRTIYQRNRQLVGECQMLDVRAEPDWYMIGFSTDVATNAEGFHCQNMLWVLDEAKGLPQWLYDAVEGSLTGGNAKAVEASTTDGADQQCPFRKHHHGERRFWNCIHLSAFDSPFVDPAEWPEYASNRNPRLLRAGKPRHGTEWPISRAADIQIATSEWVEDRRSEWEKNRRDLWETKVCGQFSTAGENNVIPLEWVESAVKAPVDAGGALEWGLDVARFGDDLDVLTKKMGKRIPWQRVWGKRSTMETVGIVMQTTGKKGVVKVDANGLGAGVFDRLAELGHPVIGIDSGEKAIESHLYVNARAEMWFNARAIFEEQYKHGNVISLPDDPELIEDLTGVRYQIMSDGRHKIEDKEKFKARFRRSPDKGDSLVYSLAHYEVEE